MAPSGKNMVRSFNLELFLWFDFIFTSVKHHFLKLLSTQFQPNSERQIYIAFLLIATSYILVIFCAVSVCRKLRKVQSNFTHPKHGHLQRQITIVLLAEVGELPPRITFNISIFQALSPLPTTVFPLLSDLISVILSVRYSWSEEVTCILSVFAPFVNVMVKLFVITSYRKAIANYLYLPQKNNVVTIF